MILPIDEIVENGIVFNLRQDLTIDEEQWLITLSKHLAPHDIDELRRILREQRERKRFTD
jgi:hypothetical protein